MKLKVVKMILAVLVIILSVYTIFTTNIKALSYGNFFIGILLMVIGIEEFQKKRKGQSFLSIAAGLFALFASFQIFTSLS
ncbi:YczI family protein [Salinibacillus aidingensis]